MIAAVIISIGFLARAGRPFAGVLISRFMITGAPHRWVTPWSLMARKMASAATPRRQTWVPAWAVTVQGKHQPLQWNMGSVHK